MTPFRLGVSLAACVALAVAAAWWFDMPLERALVAAPIIVLSVGAALAVVLLWVKVVVESVRRRGGD